MFHALNKFVTDIGVFTTKHQDFVQAACVLVVIFLMLILSVL